MNLKLGFIFLFYWLIMAGFFLMAGSVFTEDIGFEYQGQINDSAISDDEQDYGGLFGTGVSLSRLVMFTLLGLGLPEDTPAWFSIPFFLWQTLITVLSIMFVIDAIWSG